MKSTNTEKEEPKMAKTYEIDLSTANWTWWRGQTKLYAEDMYGLTFWIEELSNADTPYGPIIGYTINIIEG